MVKDIVFKFTSALHSHCSPTSSGHRCHCVRLIYVVSVVTVRGKGFYLQLFVLFGNRVSAYKPKRYLNVKSIVLFVVNNIDFNYNEMRMSVVY